MRTVETLLACIRGTTTETGWPVKATLMPGEYEDGIKIADAEMQMLRLERHTTCPDWNYTIKPRWKLV